MESIEIPKHLQKEGRDFWESVLSDFNIKDGHHLKLLENACVCLDRIAQARRQIKKHGGFYKDRFNQPKEHPAHKTERDNKIIFARLLRELNLDIEPPRESKPPALY
jgi:P27 family predicted phage terminase small subunit